MDFLEQSLTTEDGFLNPACINELESAIKNMPKTHERLSNDPEWIIKRYTSLKDITGGLALFAVKQSPYACPIDLEKVINYLDACLRKSVDWENGFAQLSLCDISNLLYDILYEQGISCFDAWNKAKKSKGTIKFVTTHNEEDPDYDFIDLDALLRNVCIHIRDDRRNFDEFNKRFEEEHRSFLTEDN